MRALQAEAAEVPERAAGRPGILGWVPRIAVWAVLGLVVFGLPLVREATDVRLYARAAIFAILGISTNVLVGYVGQLSLGHQAFVGMGAFASAYMVSRAGQPLPVALGVAMVAGALQALVLGVVSLRIRGLYFALVTLAYGLVAEASLFQIKSLTGGGAGQPAPLPPALDSPWRFYYLCLAVLALVLWVDSRLLATKAGRAFLAIRENPFVAASLGIDVRAYTLLAFVVAGAEAGLGGGLYAHYMGQVVATRVFDFGLALTLVAMTVVGGLRSRPGVVMGSAFFALLGYLVEKTGLNRVFGLIPFAPPLTQEIAPLVLGPLLLLVTLILYPGGIGELIRPLISWLAGGKFERPKAEREVVVREVRV